MAAQNYEDKNNKCSFEKGIQNKISENKEIISILMAKYIVANNSKWNSNDFPSSQIAKVVLKTFKNKMSFPITHRIVKEILKDWQKDNICKYITTTKYGHCRKTKDIYRFDQQGLNKLKEFLIHHDIKLIKSDGIPKLNIKNDETIMKSRNSMINEIKINFEEIIFDFINMNPQFEED